MPKIPIDQAPAGPEMDAAVAKVLGLSEFNDWPERWEHIISHNWNETLYSTDIAAAWELVENIAQDGWRLELRAKLLHREAIRGYSLSFDKLMDDSTLDYICISECSSVALAICRAFLKANGVEYIEVPE